MEDASKYNFASQPVEADLKVDQPLSNDLIQSIEQDTTPILFEFVNPGSSSSSKSSRRSRSAIDKPSRPMNAFLCYRQEMYKNPDGVRRIEKDNRHISIIVGANWKNMSSEQKAKYFRMAEEAKLEHKRKYPDYHFAPVPRARPAVKRNVKRASKAHLDRSEKIAQFIRDGLEGAALDAAVRKLDETEPIIEEDEVRKSKGKGKSKAASENRKRQRSSAHTAEPSRRVRSRTESPTSDSSEAGSSSDVFRSPLLPPGVFSLDSSTSSLSPLSNAGSVDVQTEEQVSPPIQTSEPSTSMPSPSNNDGYAFNYYHDVPAASQYQFQPPQYPPHATTSVHDESHVQPQPFTQSEQHTYASFSHQYPAYNQMDTQHWSSSGPVSQNMYNAPVHTQATVGPANHSHLRPQIRIEPPNQHGMHSQLQQQMHFAAQQTQNPSPLFTSRLTALRQSPSRAPMHFPSSMSAPQMSSSIPTNQAQIKSGGYEITPTPQQNQMHSGQNNLPASFTPVHPTSAPPVPNMHMMQPRPAPSPAHSFSSPESGHGPRRHLNLPRSDSGSPELGSPLNLSQNGAEGNVSTVGSGHNTNFVSSPSHLLNNAVGHVSSENIDSVDFSNVLGLLRTAGFGDAPPDHALYEAMTGFPPTSGLVCANNHLSVFNT
ncbi:hypothetical protein VKT23_005093 [Stygiomarasmius scandens]|uniref:HMG box domain-containing protein n=1 Tax=Marasmiellus scandens TaxID=2682957 RepID=A0ABR1JVD0_9AGAR